jgi:hypothetical protein
VAYGRDCGTRLCGVVRDLGTLFLWPMFATVEPCSFGQCSRLLEPGVAFAIVGTVFVWPIAIGESCSCGLCPRLVVT